MEIEAKYRIPDLTTRDHLRRLTTCAGFTLSRPRRKTVHDIYLDTPTRALLALGYALRHRQSGDTVTLTLKGLGGVHGDIHRREEIEQPLPAPLAPEAWPDGPARAHLLTLGLDPTHLQPLCEVRQTRSTRHILEGERLVAEWSLDHAILIGKRKRLSTWELELELAPQGTEDDLRRLITDLRAQLPLEPEPRSKFERALDLSLFLAMRDRALCQALAAVEGRHAQRARLLLALDDGLSARAAAERAGVSLPSALRWRALYQAQGLAALFPAALLATVSVGEKGPLGSAGAAVTSAPASAPPIGAAPPSLSAAAPSSETPSADALPSPLLPHPSHETIILAADEPSETAAVSLPLNEDAGAPPPSLAPSRAAPGLTPEDTIAEAFRKTLAFHFARMLEHEPGTRVGEDIEALHDMRVATRRMRAAFLVFGAYVEAQPLKPLLKGLRRTGRTLGAVRDLDVFREKVQHYLDTLPEQRRAELDPLLKALNQQREASRASMLAYLDSFAYHHWVEHFQQTLHQPLPEPPPLTETGPRPRQACHLIPLLVFERWANVRAFEPWIGLPDTPLSRYHQLRIAAKGLRYTLEFFGELLGKEAKLCLERVKALQDHLGDLQDAVVACGLLRDYLTWGTWGHEKHPAAPSEPVLAPGVATYLAYRQQEIQTLVGTFPSVWATITGAGFSQALLAALEKVAA